MSESNPKYETEETVVVWTPQDEDDKLMICLWSDGTWCQQEDLWEYLQIMSDDYELVEYNENIH